VLPNLANVALQEESGQVFRHICDCNYRFFNPFPYAMFVVIVTKLWWAGIFIESADAANGLIVLSDLLSAIRRFDLNYLCFRGFLSLVGTPALPTCLDRVFDGSGRYGIFWRF
jgi:hypothetical protein